MLMAAPWRFLPCISCCEECIYFSDNFNKADSTNLGAHWVEDAQDWFILGNQLYCGAANGRCRCIDMEPAGNTEIILRVDLKATAAGDQAIVGVDYDAIANNYWYVLFDFKTAFLMDMKLYQVVGGVPTLRDSVLNIGISLNFSYIVQICVGAQSVVAILGDYDEIIGYTATPSSSVAFLGTGAITSGIYFDDFSLQIHYLNNADCLYCIFGCECCDNETTPPAFAITFADVALSIPVDCPDCLDWNDCFTISQEPPPDYCNWFLRDTPCRDPGIAEGIMLMFFCQGGGSVTMQIDVWGDDMYAAFFKTVITETDTIDCMDPSNFGDFPLVVSFGAGCDWSAAKCNVQPGICP